MSRYHAVSAAIRYYKTPTSVELRHDRILVQDKPGEPEMVDIGRWKEPPHVRVANLLDDAGAIVAFTNRYGVLSARPISGTRYVNLSDVIRLRESLRQAWRGEDKVLQGTMMNIRAYLQVQSTGIEAPVEDLWTLTRLLFLQDKFSGRTRICQNPDCPAPYFLIHRKGHDKYCSQKCAVLVNVRRLRERKTQQQDNAKRGKRRRG